MKLERLENEITLMKEEIKNHATSVKDMVEKVGKVLESGSFEKRFKCDQCSYTSKTFSVLLNHKKKKHENIQQLGAVH